MAKHLSPKSYEITDIRQRRCCVKQWQQYCVFRTFQDGTARVTQLRSSGIRRPCTLPRKPSQRDRDKEARTEIRERCGETRCVVTPTATARYLISRSAPLFGCTSVPYQVSRDRKTMSKEFSICSSIPGMIHNPDLLSSSSKSYQIMIITLSLVELKSPKTGSHILIINSSST